MIGCMHPDEKLVSTLDENAVLKIRCDCGKLLLIERLPPDAAFRFHMRRLEDGWQRKHPGQRKPIR